jgi:hypothetical protein
MIREFLAGQNRSLDAPQVQEVGIGGFALFARVSDSTAYETQAPTSVVEDGSYIGDHLINAPIKLNISGEVSDVLINTPVQSASNRRLPTIGQVASFLPGRTASQAQRLARVVDTALDKYRSIDSAIKNGRNAYDFSGNKAGTKSLREQFVDYIEALHYGKQLVTISMPFRVHDSMAITNVTITRDNQRNALTFTLTAQKFRIAKTIFADVSEFYKKPAPAVASQTTGTSDKGVQSPESSGSAGAGAGGAQRKQKSVLSSLLGA